MKYKCDFMLRTVKNLLLLFKDDNMPEEKLIKEGD